MKVYKHLFDKICTIENFRIAYENAIKGKGFYKEVKEINFITKVTKINFNKLRDRDINVLGSYWGIFVHADCRHLWATYTGFKNYDAFRQFLKEKKKQKKIEELNKLINKMKWYKANSEDFEQIVSVGKGVTEVRMSVKSITPTEDDPANLLYVKGVIKGNLSTAAIKQLLLDLQKEYDKSGDVNSFILNGHKAWLPKADRVGLRNSLLIQKNNRISTTTLWLNNKPYNVSVDYILEFLERLELYAINCYNVTQSHLADIKGINNRSSLLGYDITSGYPEPIVFDIQEIIN